MASSISEKTISKLRDFDTFFINQQDILCELGKLSFNSKSKKRLNTIYPLIDSIRTSAHSVTILIRKGLMTESFILGRAFLERLVNACYLLVCEKNEFDDYVEFSMQKVQRSLETRKTAFEAIGKEVDAPDLSSIPIVGKGLEKFTSARGKEITRWSTLNIEKRIEYVKNKNAKFNNAIFLAISRYIYEDASEAVHGTLYGALFHTGLFYGTRSKEAGENYLNSLRQNLYLVLGLLVEGLIVVASKETTSKNLVAQSKANFGKLQHYFEEGHTT